MADVSAVQDTAWYNAKQEGELVYLGGVLANCIGLLYDPAAKARAADGVAAQLQLPRDVAEQLLLFLIVYTEGLVSLTLNGLLQVEKQQAYAMLQDAAACFLAKQAADRENRITGKEG